MDFDSYDLDPTVFDEMFGAGRHAAIPTVRICTTPWGRWSPADLGAIGEWVTRSFTNEGITFTVYGDDEETRADHPHRLRAPG